MTNTIESMSLDMSSLLCFQRPISTSHQQLCWSFITNLYIVFTKFTRESWLLYFFCFVAVFPVSLSHDAMHWSAVCSWGISRSHSFLISLMSWAPDCKALMRVKHKR